jgi:hypothetical protein
MIQGFVWLGIANQVEGAKTSLRSFLDQALTFLYTAAHWSGQFVANIVQTIVGYQLSAELIDPIGLLILLTVLLVVSEIAKRLVWIIVLVGWLLIVIRIALEALGQ